MGRVFNRDRDPLFVPSLAAESESLLSCSAVALRVRWFPKEVVDETTAPLAFAAVDGFREMGRLGIVCWSLNEISLMSYPFFVSTRKLFRFRVVLRWPSATLAMRPNHVGVHAPLVLSGLLGAMVSLLIYGICAKHQDRQDAKSSFLAPLVEP